MRGTLSHPFAPPSATLRGRFGVAFATALLVALASILAGCSDDGTPAQMTGSTKIEPTAVDDAGFTWPEDPSHPMIELQVRTTEQRGTILIELMPELAPTTVVNVIELADEGYYDGTTFHRVIPGFMIQGGDPKSRDRDPTNDGTGGADQNLPDEFSNAPYMRGVVGMGNRGRTDSTSAQFFIMHADNRSLDGRYNTIGRVLDGMHLVDDITRVTIDRSGRWGPKDRPIENVVIESARSVGQVAAIKAAMELERGAGAIALANETAPVPSGAESVVADATDLRADAAPPAAPMPSTAGD